MSLLNSSTLLAFSTYDFTVEARPLETMTVCLLGVIAFFIFMIVLSGIVGASININENGAGYLAVLVGSPVLLLLLWGLAHQVKTVEHRREVKSTERAVEAFVYASEELKIFADALGGKVLGCSNYEPRGNLLSCSLATEKGEILEVSCPSLQGMHGCLLTDKAYEVLRSKGFDVNIGNSNSNSNFNDNLQNPG
jgi:hypothetical protein